MTFIRFYASRSVIRTPIDSYRCRMYREQIFYIIIIYSCLTFDDWYNIMRSRTIKTNLAQLHRTIKTNLAQLHRTIKTNLAQLAQLVNTIV